MNDDYGSGGPVAAAPLARNSFFILVARVLELGAAVGVASLVARHLGVAAYGRYAFIVAFVMLFGQFISFGLEHILIREVARAPARLKDYVGAAMAWELLLGVVVLPVMLASSLAVGFAPGDGRGVLIFGVAFFLRAFYEVVYRSAFIACGAARYETALTLLFQALRLGLVAAAVGVGGGITGVLAAVLTAEAINGVVTYAVFRRRFARARPTFDRAIMKFLFQQAWPIATVGVLNNVYLQQDTLLLKWLLGDYREIGYFAAAYRLATFFVFLVVPTLWPILPDLARRAGEGTASLAAGVRRYSRLALFVVLPAAVMSAWFAPELVTTVFGGAYRPAAAALAWLAVTMAARPLGYVADASLIAAGRQRYLAVVAATVVAVNLTLDLILIPRFGFMGAAWGTAAADLAGLATTWVVTGALFRRAPLGWGAAAPTALAATVFGALFVTSALPRLWCAAGALAAFAVGTAFLLTKEERRAAAAALRITR